MIEESLKIPSELIEPAILKKCIADVSFFIKIKDFLDTRKFKEKSYFNDKKFQKIFNIICFFFEKFEKMPKKADVKFIIDKTVKEDVDIILYLKSITDKIFDESNEFSDEMVEEETLKFIKEVRAYEGFLEAQVHFQQGNFGKIPSVMEEAIRINFDKDLGKEITDISFVDDLNDVYVGSVISSGFPKIDSILGSGFLKDTMVIISGAPGTGKCSRKDVKITVEYYIDDSTGEII